MGLFGGGGFLGTIGSAIAPVPLLGTIASVGQGIGDYLGSRQTADAMRDANQQNLESAREQMAFQERMSSSAHQREVADLKAAGLNPILSANSGASTPSGAMATVNPIPSTTAAIANSARDTMKFGMDAAEATSRIKLNQQLKETSAAQGKLNTEQANVAANEARVRAYEGDKADVFRNILSFFRDDWNKFSAKPVQSNALDRWFNDFLNKSKE